MTTRLLCVTSVLAAALAAAALDDGLLAPVERQVLLVADTSPVPEVSTSPRDVPGVAGLASRVDEVVDWNAVLAPLHPAGWYPAAGELPMLARLLADRLGLRPGEPTELVLEGPAGMPGSAVAALFPGPVTVLDASLLAWGPPFPALTSEQAGRVTRLLHLPVLAGLRPLVVADTAARAEPVPADRLTAVLAALPAVDVPAGAALLVDERPGVSDTGPAELLRAVAARGVREAVLVPHPHGSAQADPATLAALAGELGVRLTVTDDGLPAEAVLARSRPALVVGGIDAALIFARDVYGLPVATVGAERVLARRKPGPQRIAATIVHATVPALGPDGVRHDPPAVDLPALVGAVAYSLSSDVLAGSRDAAAGYLAGHGGGPYVRPERLAALGLSGPEAPPAGRPGPGRPRAALRRLRRAVPR